MKKLLSFLIVVMASFAAGSLQNTQPVHAAQAPQAPQVIPGKVLQIIRPAVFRP